MAKKADTVIETENEVPSKTMTVAGVTVDMPEVYSEGHVISKAEAQSLDQTRRENIRNNTAAKVKEMLNGAEPGAVSQEMLDEIRTFILSYAEDYQFSIGSVGGARSSDPLDAILKKVAREAVHNLIKRKGFKLKQFSKEKLADLYAEAAAAPAVVEKAKEELKRRQEEAEVSLEDLNLD